MRKKKLWERNIFSIRRTFLRCLLVSISVSFLSAPRFPFESSPPTFLALSWVTLLLILPVANIIIDWLRHGVPPPASVIGIRWRWEGPIAFEHGTSWWWERMNLPLPRFWWSYQPFNKPEQREQTLVRSSCSRFSWDSHFRKLINENLSWRTKVLKHWPKFWEWNIWERSSNN